MSNRFFLQNSPNGNAFVTVAGFPQPGAKVNSQPYNGGVAQQWIPAQYPGINLNNTGGVVCVMHNADSPDLVLTAGSCQSSITLQKFQPYNLNQLWSYPGTGSAPGRWVNLATGCSIDLRGGDVTGGKVQTWTTQSNNDNQVWGLLADRDARAAVARASGELAEAAV